MKIACDRCGLKRRGPMCRVEFVRDATFMLWTARLCASCCSELGPCLKVTLRAIQEYRRTLSDAD
jgi:hypothetical protein